MYGRNDPRFRRTINQLTQNLESANESAQVGLFSISEHYLKPCFASVRDCVDPCLQTHTPKTSERARRYPRHRFARGRPEASFDFYDDWEEDENAALLGLAASDSSDGQVDPQRRHATMTYGSQGPLKPTFGQRRSGTMPYDSGPDPTIIPNQSYFGFLDRLPFKFGSRVLRYKPSAAGLQERPKDRGGKDGEEEAQTDSREGRSAPAQKHRRSRSATQDSRLTADSLSSRGDIIPSDEEADAIPLDDDDFTVVLERRATSTSIDDIGCNKARIGEQWRDTQKATSSEIPNYMNASYDGLTDAIPPAETKSASSFPSNPGYSTPETTRDTEASVGTFTPLVGSAIELGGSARPSRHVEEFPPQNQAIKTEQEIT